MGRSERIKERNQASISPNGDAINQQKISNDFGTAKTGRVSPKSGTYYFSIPLLHINTHFAFLEDKRFY